MTTPGAAGSGRRRLSTHPDVVGQLHGAVLRLLRQVDAVEVLGGGEGQTEDNSPNNSTGRC